MDKTNVVPFIPPVENVADQRADAVPEVPSPVGVADPIKPSDEGAVKRHPVDFQYHRLNWQFLKMMGMIAHYADEKYGHTEQYTLGRLEGDKSPLNHISEHMRQYITDEPHDRFGNRSFHLAAIAYNAMMEFYYNEHGGPTVGGDLYK